MEASKSKLLKKMAKAAGMSLIPGASLGAAIAGKVKNNSTRKMNQAKKDFMSAEQRKSPPRSSAPVEKSYPTSAPASSKRPQARAEPMRPKARPARIEQEAAEASAVERGNRAAKRRAEQEDILPGGMSTGVYNKGGKVKKMASGGNVCRGMGAAKRGGNFVVG
jgi:hypothetical protein